MTTQKQAEYIRQLIESRRPENMDWWNTEIISNPLIDTPAELDMETRYARINMMGCIFSLLNIRRKAQRKLSFSDTVALYQAHINDLDSLNLSAMSTAEASELIDSLK